MANKRTIAWNAAMRDLRTDRMRRAGVREERLRATAGLRSSSTLSSWRGRSGRRYIVGVHPLNEEELLDVTDAVILAVRRDRDGTGTVIDRKSTRLNSSHANISYAVFCLKKK